MSTVVRTMCPMNCHPTLCGMLVEIEDGRVRSSAKRSVHAFQRAANSVATSSPYRTSPSRAPMYHFAGLVVDGGVGVSQLSRRVSSDMVLTVSNSCTTLRLASTFSGASPDSGTSLRYFASTSAHSIPREADPRGKST